MLTALMGMIEILLYCGFIIGMVFCGFIVLLFAFSLPFFLLGLVISGVITLYEKLRDLYIVHKFRKELKYKDEHDIEDK